MTHPLTEEHIALLEASLAKIENDYRPTCETSRYGNGCAGATDESLDFWRRAVDCVPAMIAEVRHHRSRLSSEDVEALRFAAKVVGASEHLFADRLADPRIKAHVEQCQRALAVLERLCAAKETL